ncbi:mucin-5AC-like isoform X10 [Rana temporaria]|uniref:mucin-5AC-like isoform X10 n=1 Tax=Rana temporaria TaxID=8407 RepID=UPI001AAD33A2|nr:mucin-5AC-like isoform X10 [Rana temporaria]
MGTSNRIPLWILLVILAPLNAQIQHGDYASEETETETYDYTVDETVQQKQLIQQQQQEQSGAPRISVIQVSTNLPVKALNVAHNNRVCSTWGNFHFKNFDGDIFDFPGTCNYVFASHCKSTYEDFNIQMRRTVVNNVPVIEKISMKLDGLIVQIDSNAVSVNGNRAQLPFSGSGIQIEKHGVYLTVSSKLGLIFRWNDDDSILLELESKYANTTCGLCGDFNGISIHNEFIANGIQMTAAQFGNLQKLDGPTELCPDVPPTPKSSCADFEKICETALLSASFSSCHSLVAVEQYIETCEQDLCQCKDITQCLCNTFAEYSRQCAHAGGHPENWRTKDLCPKSCPYNMVFRECGSPCLDTCSNPERSVLCENHCMEGCFCPPGTVFDDINDSGCVPLETCSCTFNSNAYAAGTAYSTSCSACMCSGGKWSCKNLPCPASCSIEGGSHITTYDQTHYSIHGDCNYVLSKACDGESFIVLAEMRTCGLTESETCLKSTTIILNGGETIIVIKPCGSVFVNSIYTQLPVSAANVTIFRPSSFYIIVHTNLGVQIVAQLTPFMQVYVALDPAYKGLACGLCGNFNDKQSDDFQTISGVIEGTAASFANTWKTQGTCSNVKNVYEDPCSLSVENANYAQHWCGLISDPTGPFASCHATVNPNLYKQNCMFDTCNCEKSEECMCASLSSYVRACATKGIILTGWRENVCTKYMHTCPKSLNYSYSTSTCQPTCRSLSEPDVTCSIKFIPVDGCTCSKGFYIDDSGKCVPAAACPCYYKGSAVPSGEVVHDNGIMCTCAQGKLSCIGSVETACKSPMAYFDCKNATVGTKGSECQKSCQTLDMACYSAKCVSGCVCPAGLVADGKGGCIKEDDCPCVHNDGTYQPGEQVKMKCNTCTCKNRMWQCTQNPCLATCAVYGDGHYTTFDAKSYSFSGDCEYILAQDHCGQAANSSTFRVITENIPCGTTGTTCSKSIKVFMENYELVLTEEHVEVVERGIGGVVPYKVRHMGIYLIIEADNGLILMWDKKTSIFIKLSKEFEGKVCGLCGNYDGNGNNDFTTRSQSVVGDIAEFGNSWKIAQSCPDANVPKDACTANPYRKSWAQRKCNIINSLVFSACHAQVDPSKYYDACVADACACDTGGDCECFCTAVAAYAQACGETGICVSWRTPSICPLFCDYYNPKGECEWHYKPCGTPCLKTCRNPSGKCLHELAGLEGCYPSCPAAKPFFDDEEMECVAQCGCYDDEGNHFRVGQTVPSIKNCQTCVCSLSGMECKYQKEACHCEYQGKMFQYNDVVYNTTDGIGGCILAICKENGTIYRDITDGCYITPTPFTFTTTNPTTTSGTTTTHSTTICVKEECKWSEWIDGSHPELGMQNGDFDTYENIRAKGISICNHPQDIECRAEMFPNAPLSELEQNVQCNVSFGLICWNKEQLPPICHNYEIRVKCCSFVPCVPTTQSITSTETPTTTTPTTPQPTTKTTHSATTSSATTEIISTPSTTTEPTTSIVPSTTVCQPQCIWTNWIDVDTPTSGLDGGDKETFENIMAKGKNICKYPQNIKCRATDYPDISIENVGQIVKCDITVGLVCNNKDQIGNVKQCYNYQIQVLCCDDYSHCSITPVPTTTTTSTPTTSTTTILTTTTETTTTPKPTTTSTSTPTTTKVTTTKPPTTTESTTTSVSTTTEATKSTTQTTPETTTAESSSTTPKPTTHKHCFCHVGDKFYSPGEILYNTIDEAGCSFYAVCNDLCEAGRFAGPCTTTTQTTISPTTPRSTTSQKTTTTPTTTGSTVVQTTPVEGCPPRKTNETWINDQCEEVTCHGNNITIHKPVTCPEVKEITCTNGFPPIKKKSADSCCYHYECQCVCRGWGDPHYVTFDGTYYTFLDNCTYVLVQEIAPKYDNFRILVDNYFCDADDGLSCPQSILIYYKSNEIVLTRMVYEGRMRSRIRFNNIWISPGFTKDGITITTAGVKMNVEIPEIDAFISFSGMIFVINLPFSKFAYNTEGQCGTCSNNSTEDCRMPDGKIVKDCSAMAPHWRVNTTTPGCSKPPPPTPPSPTPPPPTPPPTCKSSQLCDIILSDIFAACHKIILPKPYHNGCIFDACRIRNDSVQCSSLEIYASLCSANGICVDWRGKTGDHCPYNCPAGKVYNPCGPVHVKTCENKLIENVATGTTEGCFCPAGTTLFNSYTDTCVKSCACVGPEGMPKAPAETWTSGCKKCVCEANSLTVQCQLLSCPKLAPITCEKEGFIPVTLPNPEEPCCMQNKCQCNSTNCLHKEMKCETGFEATPVLLKGDCCPKYECTVPVCLDHDKTYKTNETWINDQCEEVTCHGNNITTHKPVTCPEVKEITCTNGFPPIKKKSADSCCYHYECQCVCSGWGDPHYLTFDGTYYTFLDNCTYVLVQEITPKYDNFRILVDNYFCDADDGLSCPQSILIYYKSNEIVLTRMLYEGRVRSRIRFNNNWISPGFTKDGITTTTVGIKMNVEIPEINVFISFSGMIFVINLPFSKFAYNTEGQCGTCSNNRTEDCRMPDGNIVKDCSSMASHWRVNTTTLGCSKPPPPTPPSPPTPSSPPTLPSTSTPPPSTPSSPPTPPPSTPPPTCKPSQQCDIILSDIFAECHKIILPKPYHEGCVFDACRIRNDSVQCSSLEIYASLCSANGICVDWRGKTGGHCPYNCPTGKVYNPCGPLHVKTCENKHIENVATSTTEGCFCSAGTTLFNSYTDTCVKSCACVGPDGMPKAPAETWTSGCKKCVCEANSLTVQCEPLSCPKLTPITCEKEGVIPVTRTNPKEPCCMENVCECNSTYCLHKEKKCETGFEAIPVLLEGDCCPKYECIVMPVCVYHDEIYKPGHPIPQAKDSCHECECSYEIDAVTLLHLVNCTPIACKKECDKGFQYMDVQGQCCGHCVQVECIMKMKNDEIMTIPPGEIWSPSADNCTYHQCVQNGEHFDIHITSKECAVPSEKDCPLGYNYEKDEGECCGKCIQVACVMKMKDGTTQVLQPGETWSPSNEPCTKYKCEITEGQYIPTEIPTSCPSEECPLGTKYEKAEGECCGKCIHVACVIRLKDNTTKILQPGDTWTPPDQPCVKYECEIIDDQFNPTEIRRACPIEDCPQGYKYENIEGQCCGKCVQVSCVMKLKDNTTKILQPGETWSSPDQPCVKYECEIIDDQFNPTEIRRACPIEDCPLGTKYEKAEGECCGKCIQVACVIRLKDNTTKILQPGDTWTPPDQPCATYECEIIDDQFNPTEIRRACPIEDCPQGYKYENVEGQCCGKCVQVSCVMKLKDNTTKILQPGETWSSPDQPCVKYECEIIDDQFNPTEIRRACPIEDCPLGYKYETTPEKCCGTCVKVGCVMTLSDNSTQILKPGEVYVSPEDKCVSHECTSSLDMKEVTKTCPAFNPKDCLEGTIRSTEDGCCKTCESALKGCQVHKQSRQIKSGTCVSDEVVELSNCGGGCMTSSMYSIDANKMEHKCSCCQEVKTSKREVNLKCLDKTSTVYTYIYAEECGCKTTECDKDIPQQEQQQVNQEQQQQKIN